jgi:hypothetical protein
MKHINLISLIIMMVALNGCPSDSQAGVSVGFQTILSGSTPINGEQGNRKIEFIHNQLSFEATLSSYSNVPVEQIDFSENQVILLSMGEKPTGGYTIRVDSVEEINGTLKLIATETHPGSNCMVTQALTAPYLFVKVLSVERIETVVVRTEVVDCNAS